MGQLILRWRCKELIFDATNKMLLKEPIPGIIRQYPLTELESEQLVMKITDGDFIGQRKVLRQINARIRIE